MALFFEKLEILCCAVFGFVWLYYQLAIAPLSCRLRVVSLLFLIILLHLYYSRRFTL